MRGTPENDAAEMLSDEEEDGGTSMRGVDGDLDEDEGIDAHSFVNHDCYFINDCFLSFCVGVVIIHQLRIGIFSVSMCHAHHYVICFYKFHE